MRFSFEDIQRIHSETGSKRSRPLLYPVEGGVKDVRIHVEFEYLDGGYAEFSRNIPWVPTDRRSSTTRDCQPPQPETPVIPQRLPPPATALHETLPIVHQPEVVAHVKDFRSDANHEMNRVDLFLRVLASLLGAKK